MEKKSQLCRCILVTKYIFYFIQLNGFYSCYVGLPDILWFQVVACVTGHSLLYLPFLMLAVGGLFVYAADCCVRAVLCSDIIMVLYT